ADADLSMPIEQVERFLPPKLEDCDVAIGSREAPGARRIGEPRRRHLVGRGFNLLVRLLALPGIRDSQCGFKLFTAAAAEALFPLQRLQGWGFDVEVLYLARLQQRLGPMLGASRAIESEMEILKSRVIGERAAVRLRRHYALSPLPRGVSLELADVRVTEKTLPGPYLVTFVDDAGEYRVKDPQGRMIGAGRPDRAFEAGGLSFVLSKVSAQSGSSFEIVIPKLTAIANALRSRLIVGVIRGTDIVSLGVRGNNPQEITDTVNAFAETYVDFARQQKILQLVSIRQFLDKQLGILRQDLLGTGKTLADMGSEQKGPESMLGVLRRTDPGSNAPTSVGYGASFNGIAPLLTMQSNGGVASAKSAMARPINIIESGPAAGVMGAVVLGKRLGHSKIVTFD
ncbi:MAG: hypothetical protein HYU27_10660, partial [Acidobacteria bacterium]|nr:hypothetical protein [Acidobacteriota bacterium]